MPSRARFNLLYLCMLLSWSSVSCYPFNTWLIKTSFTGTILRAEESGIQTGFTVSCPRKSEVICSYPLFYFGVYFQVDQLQGDETSQVTYGAKVVWKANRGRPVRVGASLQFRREGDLVLLDEHGDSVWSTNTSGDGAVSIVLQPSGNLVLYNVGGESVWESFDHPTDALFPGQPLRVGSKLVSGSLDGNRSDGYFSLEVERHAVALYAQAPEGAQLYGVWTSEVEISFIRLDENGSLGVYGTKGDLVWSSPGLGPFNDRIQLLKLQPDGELQLQYLTRLRFENHTLMDHFNPNDSTGSTSTLPGACGVNGMVRAHDQACRCPSPNATHWIDNKDRSYGHCSPEPQTFTCGHPYKFPSEYLMSEPSPRTYVNYEPLRYMKPLVSLTVRECNTRCISNCSCAGTLVQELNESGYTMCYHLSVIYTLKESATPGFTVFFKVRNGSFVYPVTLAPDAGKPMPSNSTQRRRSRKGSRSQSAVLIGSILAIVLVTLAGVGFLTFHWKRKLDAYLLGEGPDFTSAVLKLPRPFTYAELHTATKGFSKKIGTGASGVVFEGTLHDGTKVAVKQLTTSNQGRKQFRAEVSAIGSIRHRNLVRLRGFCTQKTSACLLVYEHAANGSLDKWIFETGNLEWSRRFNVCLDVARGLSYLHGECRDRVLHLDIKPQNILLDEEFCAKIADFGLSRMVEQGEKSVPVTMIRGTPGYMAPEWLQLRVTDKLDVYSFGVVVLEVVTGLRALHSCGKSPRFLTSWAFERARRGRRLEMVDKRLKSGLGDELTREQVEKMIRVGLWCVQADPVKRPSMVEVVKMVEGKLEVGEPPLPPAERHNGAGGDTSLQLNFLMEMINNHH